MVEVRLRIWDFMRFLRKCAWSWLDNNCSGTVNNLPIGRRFLYDDRITYRWDEVSDAHQNVDEVKETLRSWFNVLTAITQVTRPFSILNEIVENVHSPESNRNQTTVFLPTYHIMWFLPSVNDLWLFMHRNVWAVCYKGLQTSLKSTAG